jgi:hypothetical protein
LTDSTRLRDIVDCIVSSRRKDNHGVVVAVYAHGWNHDAHWDFRADTGDSNLAAFRAVLTGLTLREAERYTSGFAAGRTVIGVYLGWRGLAPGNVLSFPGRYRVAQRIGQGADLRRALAAILRATKETGRSGASNLDSPLILAGHSMGGRMLQAALSESLRDPGRDVLWSTRSYAGRCVQVTAGQQAAAFPDLILLLNPASTSTMALELRRRLEAAGVRKTVSCGPRPFVAPVVISVTAENDWATKWPMVVGAGAKGEGHDARVLSHEVRAEPGLVRCLPKSNDHIAIDFEQAWHCPRIPLITDGVLRGAVVDLPQVDSARAICHVRFRVRPFGQQVQSAYWIVSVPPTVVDAHNDIFNVRVNSLMMTFAQISGSVMSIARDWQDTFEAESGPCVRG